MADIEDRLKSHSSAFEGLLSLIPGDKYFPGDNSNQWSKRKQSKEEHKKAKKAKLDPDSATTAAEVRAKRQRDGNNDSGDELEGGGSEAEHAPKPKKAKKEKKQKTQPTTKKGGVENVEEKAPAKSLENQNKGEKTPVKSPAQRPAKKGKGKASPAANDVAPPPEVISEPAMPENEDDNGDEEMAEVNGFAGLETPSESAEFSTNTEPASETSDVKRPAKPVLDPAQRAEQRARLAARIEALRAQRKADNADGSTARTRQDLLEARRKKDALRKERKKQARLTAKQAQQDTLNTAETSSAAAATSVNAPAAPAIIKDFSFGRVAFDDGRELDAKLQDFQKDKKKKGPTDLLGQLKHTEAKKRRIENMNEEKKEAVIEKEKWSKALKQAVGEKVKDDEKLLKKALKRQESQKRKSANEWNERLASQAKAQAARQKKREDNLQTRKDAKKVGKSGKKGVVMKKGGKPMGKKGPKKASRPGFEGGMKLGKGKKKQ